MTYEIKTFLSKIFKIKKDLRANRLIQAILLINFKIHQSSLSLKTIPEV